MRSQPLTRQLCPIGCIRRRGCAKCALLAGFPRPKERSIVTRMTDGGRALVLGGGGVTGIAWETGLLAGLAEAGIDLTSADLVVGTSAGSVVGAQILSGVSIKALYAEQLVEPRAEGGAKIGATTTLRYAAAMLWRGGQEQARATRPRRPESAHRARVG